MNSIGSKKSTLIGFVTVFLAILLVAGSVYFVMSWESPLIEEDIAVDAPIELEPTPIVAEIFEEEEETVHFNTPGEMRGVFLTPGQDFVLSSSATTDSVKKQIDTALDNAKDLMLNAVIIDTAYGDEVIYNTQDAPKASPDFDIMAYIVEESRDRNLYTYAIFDTTPYQQSELPTVALAVGAGTIDKLSTNLREFAETYKLDGILIDGYQNQSAEDSYSVYQLLGGSIGFENFMKQSPEAIVKTASNTIRTHSKGTQVGLLADSVWANAEEHEDGSNTKARFTSLVDGNADTKGFLEEELFDFVAVKAYGSLTDSSEPFDEVVSWWADVARENVVPMYVVHASDKICTEETGWESHDQITRQVIEAEDYSGYRGSIFNNLTRLVENPKEATSTLVKYYQNEVEAAHILTELEITKPSQTTYTTFEPVVTFTGASDPNSDVTINGEIIATDESGYFTVTIDLDAGLNTFTIEHKEKTLNYAITRQVQVLKEMSPMGSIATEGGMTITITATAYADASVWATINGSTVYMEIDDAVEDEVDRDSSYKLFVGEYTAPAATSSEQNLGNIVVSATWDGHSDSITGASVKVNKRAQVSDGVPVVITASQARTYPPDTLNNIPKNTCYPLPQGAMDYAVGDEIVYKKGSTTYTYQVLASGMRVESGNISATSEYASGNSITGLEVEADRSYTYVRLKMSQKVAYSFSYSSTGVQVEFHYTSSVPQDLSLSQNPIFTSAKWSDTTLKLNFVKEGGFAGYKGYFDDNGNLVLRFNNPPSSISSAKICVDPGHGGSDPGATGFLADYPERVLNRQIAAKLADELESRGATVLLLDTSGGMSLANRVAKAESWGADLYISVHNNTASSSSAAGTEVFYFYPFSRPMASYGSSNVSSALNTNNRGPKQSHYNVTLSSQFPSVLVECGFMSNKNEYEKLINSKYQSRIATGIADAAASSIKSQSTGSTATGIQSVGSSVTAGGGLFSGDSADDDDTGATIPNFGSNAASDEYTIEDLEVTLRVGKTHTITVMSGSSKVSASEFTFESTDEDVATVNSSGKVTAVGEGSCDIVVESSDGEYGMAVEITVN